MKTIKGRILPEVMIDEAGQSLKILRVTAKDASHMPLHYSTGEAVVVCQQGSGILFMNGQEHQIKEGSCLVISEGVPHSLTTSNNFKALVIMDVKSKIEFEKQ